MIKSKFGFTFQVFEVSCKVLFYCIFWLQISVTVYTKVTCLKLCSFHKITTCGQDQARPETAWETFQFGVALLSSSRVHKKLFFFEVGIRPKKVTSASSSGHGTIAVEQSNTYSVSSSTNQSLFFSNYVS